MNWLTIGPGPATGYWNTPESGFEGSVNVDSDDLKQPK